MVENLSLHKYVERFDRVKLSVIIVVKNDAVGLNETIASLTSLGNECLEVIVWINSKTVSIQEHIAISVSRADKVISGFDIGIFDAMNRALVFACGHFVMFLNARDKIIQPFSVCELDKPALVSVQYVDYFGKMKSVKISRNIKLGIPFCHQGMILPRIGYRYDINLKYGADYLALLNFDLQWPLPLLQNGLIHYDTSGVSTINRWESDKWTGRVIRDRFGCIWASVYIVKCLIKLSIKRIYDLKRKLSGW